MSQQGTVILELLLCDERWPGPSDEAFLDYLNEIADRGVAEMVNVERRPRRRRFIVSGPADQVFVAKMAAS